MTGLPVWRAACKWAVEGDLLLGGHLWLRNGNQPGFAEIGGTTAGVIQACTQPSPGRSCTRGSDQRM